MKKACFLATTLLAVTCSWNSAYAITDSYEAINYINAVTRQIPVATTETMTADILVARPLGIAATAAGAVLFVISLPFSLLGGNTPQAAYELVGLPAQVTFARPLGLPY